MRSGNMIHMALAAGMLLLGSPLAAPAQTYDPALWDGLEWRNIGPNRGGRSIAVGGSDSRPLEYYFGATGGGLWKTTDAGTTWRPVTDGKIDVSSVGAVAVCEANPDVVYIGTGEAQLRGNVQPGDGVYKTTDAGETWEHIGLEEARNISRIRVDHDDCDRAFVAALGHYGMPNPERGIYRTLDGGASWEKVLYRDDQSGGVEIRISRAQPDVLYASLWEVYRKPWQLSSGGPGSGLFKSTDGGDTWTELTRNTGLPEGVIGKIGVDVSPANPDRVWAIIEADQGGVFRSDDAGQSWERINEERKLRQRAFYYTRIYADPNDENVVYALNTGFYRSEDGGETFEPIRVPHGDNHDLWIAPSDSDRMIEANDGGGNVSFNGGESWTEQDYPTAQMYHLMTTNHDPYFVCGGQQDNSTICVPSDGWDHLLARGLGGDGDYGFAVGGCESGYVAHDPENMDLYYAGCYGGQLTRYDHDTGQERAINVWPDNPMGWSAGDIRERFQWTFPIIVSPHDPDVLYVASQHLFRSTNEGHSWERISPDLTRADPETLGPSGGPITRDQTSVEYYGTIFTVAPSHHEPQVIWTGSDDGLIHVTRDGGATWQNVTPPDLPAHTRVSIVEASPHRPGAAYFAGNRYLLDDFEPYLYKTEDYGESWVRIDAGIPRNHFTRAIREDPHRERLLVAATEFGVQVSFDDGQSWQPLQQNLPAVQVSDIMFRDDDLVIATHGRSFWIMDDIQPLREMSPQVAGADVHLFQPVDAIRGMEGANFYYRLAEDVDEVTIEILEADGDVIRSFTGTPADTVSEEDGNGFGPRRQDETPPVEAGMHKFTWNLRYPGATTFPGLIMWAAGTEFGPTAVPGEYQVRLTAEGETQTRRFAVRLDPRVEGATVADLREQFQVSQQIVEQLTAANDAVRLIRGVKNQVDDRLERTDERDIRDLGNEVNRSLSQVEEDLYQVRNESNQDPLNFPIMLNNRVGALLGVVQSGDYPPTAQAYEALRALSEQIDQEIVEMNEVLDTRLARLNERLRDEGLEPVERIMIPEEEEEEEATS